MSLYVDTVVQMSKMLRNLAAFLAKARAFAEAKGCSPDDFVGFRLTPDMRPLAFQVQSACDTAKFVASRLTGVEPPSHADDETTLAQLEERIEKVLAFLATFDEAQFAGAAEREVRLPFLPGKAALGGDYLRELVLPNFYFHVATAYALIRMAGVGLAKMDFIGGLTLHDVAGSEAEPT